jgi:hypothetical protein
MQSYVHEVLFEMRSFNGIYCMKCTCEQAAELARTLQLEASRGNEMSSLRADEVAEMTRHLMEAQREREDLNKRVEQVSFLCSARCFYFMRTFSRYFLFGSLLLSSTTFFLFKPLQQATLLAKSLQAESEAKEQERISQQSSEVIQS